MKSDRHEIAYGEYVIAFVLIRRERRTLEIGVEPDASVTVVAPSDADISEILPKVRKRAAWIRRQQRYFQQFLPRTPARRFVSGETHLYLGRQYRLKVVAAEAARVTLARGFIRVETEHPGDPERTERLVGQWYRDRASIKFSERLEMNLQRFPSPDAVRPKSLSIRVMRQRWGSLSPSATLLLNRRLIEAPLDAIDYVITHELCHMTIPNHGTEFYDLLDRVLPDWWKRKHRLERAMA